MYPCICVFTFKDFLSLVEKYRYLIEYFCYSLSNKTFNSLVIRYYITNFQTSIIIFPTGLSRLPSSLLRDQESQGSQASSSPARPPPVSLSRASGHGAAQAQAPAPVSTRPAADGVNIYITAFKSIMLLNG